MIIVSSIAQNQHRGFRPYLASVLFPEHFECVAVVGMPIDPDNISFGIHAVNGDTDVLNTLEEASDLIDTVDEYE